MAPGFRGRGRGRGTYKATHFSGRKRQRGGHAISNESRGVLNSESVLRDKGDIEKAQAFDALDNNLGFPKYSEGPPRQGWLINMKETSMLDSSGVTKSAVDFYFLQDDGSMFKTTIAYEPYFYVACRKGADAHVEEWLKRRFEELIVRIERVRKEDLDMPNHLVGLQRSYLRLKFSTVADLLTVRREVLPLATRNRSRLDAVDTYAEVVSGDMEDWGAGSSGGARDNLDTDPAGFASEAGTHFSPEDSIIDIREYDVTYYLRVAIDLDIRVGLWYDVVAAAGEVTLKCITERVDRAEPVVLAYDIETTKAPLKFPDDSVDQIMMVSYMIDGQGFLVTNREIVGADLEDFEYTPKPDYEGPFMIFNERDEASLIRRFFEHIKEARPTVIATYNGDSFDFPFVLARAEMHGIDMFQEIGFYRDSENEFKSRACVHMDCFRWVQRDSYLPQGSQGLKAVTVAKLGYNPIELDPELMTPYAIEKPQELAQYSVSDAVATYYLYMKYVHPFIFSLCNIIPLMPDEVLRKGTGTLCETLLMVEAYKSNVIIPNRHEESHNNMYEGHLLENETYVGGHVEALEAGVFRSDIASDFRIHPPAAQQLIDQLDDALKFTLTVEENVKLEDVTNYDEVRSEIARMLAHLRDNPIRSDTPLIYHLDVAAMYPNIMLSNRLQPDSMVDEATCAACDYNRPGKQCQRRLKWAWRGEYFPAKLDEFKMVRNALEQERFPARRPEDPPRRFVDLAPSEQTALLHKRLGDYSRKVYAKTKITKIETKEAIVCQRENPFYIDTVRTFRDRRYTYKGLHKTWKRNADAAADVATATHAKSMVVLYDSLQLAHKCILNSFYGYVMRKGARWHSMEMAGITCLTGATIIQLARQLVEQVGRPLELDTDGIWCMLPSSFPDQFTFTLASGKKVSINYPCTMLNHLVHRDFTNDQYHEVVDAATGAHRVRSENSIFFELDGPYRAMILPSSKEEDKLIKKRYAVFNDDGSLAELKGFEVKRRGELQLIKLFQGQIFSKFLQGTTLLECYAAVAAVADQWLDVLFNHGATLPDDELVELIAENRSMSKTLAEYAGQKSTSISTARRLAEFLGAQMVRDKGLSCRFIISAKPHGAPVTERAVPIAIFSAEQSVKQHYLRKWLKDHSVTDFDIRAILDWDYYIERFGSVVQKLITIPAALQKVPNPVPRVRHPDWLARRIMTLGDKFKQHRIDDMFRKVKPVERGTAERSEAGEKGSSTAAANDTAPSAETTTAITPLTGFRPVDRTKPRVVAAPPPPRGPKPEVMDDYPAYVAYMKTEWREKRAELLSGGGPRAGGVLGSLLHQQTTRLASQFWDIVQLVPSETRPGEFRVWLLIDDTLQNVKLRVEREFFVNFFAKPASFPPEAVVEDIVRHLPRDHPVHALVRIRTSEAAFEAHQARYSELLNSPLVDGVYELQVPLEVRALLRLGATCVPHGVRLAKGLDSHFELSELRGAGEARVGKPRAYRYLGARMQHVYLYHAFSGTRHVFGLFVPHTKHATVVIVEPGTARNIQAQGLEGQYEEGLQKRKATSEASHQGEREGPHDSGAGATSSSKASGKASASHASRTTPPAFEYPQSMTYDVTYTTTETSALRTLTKHLGVLAASRRATLLVVQSSRPASHFHSAVRGRFPVLHMAAARTTFPALQWQAPACRRMLAHFLGVSAWISERVALAERSDLPLCNLGLGGDDVPLALIDAEFARRLTRADCVLWWSPQLRPDLGGRERDANAPAPAPAPETGQAGCYTAACVELDVRNLAVDAVLQSALVYELEAGDAEGTHLSAGNSFGFGGQSNLDDLARPAGELGDAMVPAQTFSLLRAMLRAWSAAAGGAGRAQLLIQHFYRWVSSPAAHLFDPGLASFVQGLMRKTFSQLLSEFRRVGSGIVHADFGKVFLVTNKPTALSAYAYANYIVASINSRELFKYLVLEIVHFWDMLVWYDIHNFGGVLKVIDDASETTGSRAPASQNLAITMDWNLARFLPPPLEEQFSAAVGLFIHGLYEAKCDAHQDARTPLRVVDNSAAETGKGRERLDELELGQRFITTSLTRELLKTVNRIQRQQLDHAADFAFPALPGSHLKLTSPVLEFIKSVCAVFALSRDLLPQVTILKRNLLEIVKVREFDQRAVFKNPGRAFRVRNVVCSVCNFARDLDLCRDNLALETRQFSCPRCGKDYNSHAIQGLIIESLMRLLESHTLSDLRCEKCREMKSTNLNVQCGCSGTYQLSTDTHFAARLQVAKRVAEYYSMDELEAFVTSLSRV